MDARQEDVIEKAIHRLRKKLEQGAHTDKVQYMFNCL